MLLPYQHANKVKAYQKKFVICKGKHKQNYNVFRPFKNLDYYCLQLMKIRNSAYQMTIADLLYEEGEPQEVIAQKVDRSQNAV